MGPQDLAALLSAIAWPTTVLVAGLLFRTPLYKFLEQLANSAKLSMVKIRFWGVELELPVEQATAVLNKIQEEIIDTLGRLSAPEVALFEKIADNKGLTVDELSEGVFKRDVSPEHDQLRHLREWRLIEQDRAGGKPGGNWEGYNRPYITKFGLLVLSLHRQGRNEKDSRPISEKSTATHSDE
jgi:hypothetical protein